MLCAALMLPEALLPALPVVALDVADVLVPEVVVDPPVVDPDTPEVESSVPVTSTLWPRWVLSSLSFPVRT